MALAPAEIIVTASDGSVQRHKVEKPVVMIGRHPECDIVLNDAMSSRRHCKVERLPSGVFYAEDPGSANGTLLNSAPLRQRMMIKSGDTIQIGSTLITLRVEFVAMSGMRASPKFDPTLSIVRMEDESEAAGPVVNYSAKADGAIVSADDLNDPGKFKRVAERLKLLIEVSQSMGASLDPHQLLTSSLGKLFEVFPQVERGIIVLYGPDGSLPTTLATEKEGNTSLDRRKGAITRVKYRGAFPADNEVKLSRSVLNRVRKERQAIIAEPASSGMSLASMGITSLMCAPLIVGKDDLGIIQLETKNIQQTFKPEDLQVLTAVAGQIAVVIRNSELVLTAAASAAQRENLSRFLSPQLVEEILKDNKLGVGVNLKGVVKKGTIFFSDIVSFTKLAAKMKAEDVVTLLNRYFTVMQNIIFRRGGSIDKCAGDNIMAHWGVLGEQSNFTLGAVTASVEMQNALFVFNRDENNKKGDDKIVLPPVPLGHGIGLNTGEICAGNIGSDRKIEFTVIGDAVNLSARIESMAGRGQTFLGAPTWEEVKDQSFCVRMPDCWVKNVAYPLPIYSVRGIVPPEAVQGRAITDLVISDILFSLPCQLALAGGAKVPAVVTAILPGAGTNCRIAMQIERYIPPGTLAAIEWGLAEKTQIPKVQGEVERSWNPADETQKNESNAASIPKGHGYGELLFNVAALPAEIAAWKPGTLLVSEFKTPEDIIRE